MNVDSLPETVTVDGMYDPKHPEIQYWGKASRQADGRYKCYANVGGLLCVVEVSIRFSESETDLRP